LRNRSEVILGYVPNGRRASQDGQSPGWWSARGLAIMRESSINVILADLRHTS